MGGVVVDGRCGAAPLRDVVSRGPRRLPHTVVVVIGGPCHRVNTATL